MSAAATTSGRWDGPSLDLAVEGMHCASCVGRVERAFLAVPGVTAAEVNLATGRARIGAIPGRATVEALVEAAGALGYRAERLSDHSAAPDGVAARREAHEAEGRRSLRLAAALAAAIVTLEMGAHLVPAVHDLIVATIGMRGSWVVQFGLATLVLAGPGLAFFRSGAPALVRGAPDMDSLVALGTGAAYVYSTVATFAPAIMPAGTVNVYFEATAVIVVLVLLGRSLEARARGRTSAAIGRLLDLAPPTARVLRDGRFEEVPVAAVRPGDLVQLRPGERVPVDGVVVEGASRVDEAMITGEPVPVRKIEGSAVVGGAVNQLGALVVRATRVGRDAVLGQIVRAVEEAQASKLPIQALVDRVTGRFVPAVIAVAAATLLAWTAFGPEPALAYGIVNAVAVLIVACPCAMGLATPTSIMVGTGRGAELGILFRRGEALQRLAEARIVAFDKTGTLTQGRPELTAFTPAPGFARAETLAAFAAAESASEHPTARAVVTAAEREGLTAPAADRFEAVPGLGVRADVAGVQVEIGAERFMLSLGIDVVPFAAEADRLRRDGVTPLYGVIGGRAAALFAVSDPVRDTAAAAVSSLRALGLEVAMITGDDPATARAVARTLGIDEVTAGVLPAGKVAALRDLRARFGPVAFVGDGINDAPVLAAADTGVAIGTGTEIAIEAADVVLMSGDPAGVARAVRLSRATIANIRQNLFWAFAYNVALIPVAAGALVPLGGALLSPIWAAGAMALSSLLVLGNALRLRRFTVAR